MPIVAGPFVRFNDFKLNRYKGVMDLENDTIKLVLVSSASNGISKALTPATYANLTNELATSGGYTSGGATAANPTLSGGGAVDEIGFDTDPVTFSGSGGGFSFRAAILVDTTSGHLIAYCLGDATNVDVIVGPGVDLTFQIVGVFADN